MILTITLNMSIDKVMRVEKLRVGNLNRVDVVSCLPGGKGINVARAIKSLGTDEISVSGFTGGYNGQYIKEKLTEEHIKAVTFEAGGESRICNIIVEDSSRITEIYEKGVLVSERIQKDYIKLANDNFRNFKIVAISGSLPQGIDEDYYMRLVSLLDRKQYIFLDFSGQSLINALRLRKCYMVKLNKKEFCETFGVKEVSKKILSSISSEFLIPIISVTLGDKGALFFFQNRLFKVWSSEEVQVLNPIGAGDTFLGGFIHSFACNKDVFNSFRVALAASKSNITLYEAGKINNKNFNKILKNIVIKEV